MDRKIGSLSSRDLTKIMQLVVEITSKKFHEFSLVAIKNAKGEYLQKYDNRWKCWLFPYVRSTDDNKSNIDNYVSKLVATPTVTQYINHAKQCKYSENDKVYKIYHHKLYEVILDTLPEHMLQKEFNIDNTRYKWLSLTELEQNENIMKKNEDIIAFVKANCF